MELLTIMHHDDPKGSTFLWFLSECLNLFLNNLLVYSTICVSFIGVNIE